MSSRYYEDPVVAEIHAIRDKMVEACDGDHPKLMQQVRQRQKASQRNIISTTADGRGTEQAVQSDGERRVS